MLRGTSIQNFIKYQRVVTTQMQKFATMVTHCLGRFQDS